MTNLNHRILATAVPVGVLLFVCALHAQDSKTPKPKVVGTFQGAAITEQELNNAAAHQLANWEVQRLEAEASFARIKHRILEVALDELFADRILTAEAARQGITKEALYAREVTQKVMDPTQSEIQSYYVANRQQFPKPLDQKLNNEIEQHLKAERIDKARAELLEPLKRQYSAIAMLEPLRMNLKTEGSPSRGQAGAIVTLVAFSDYACQDCAALAGTLRQVEAKYGKQVRLVYKNFPISKLHPAAEKAAEASLCAADQHRFWEMHDLLYQEQDRLTETDLQAKAAKLQLDITSFNACLSSGSHAVQVRDDMLDGARVGVTGTPALFVNGLAVSDPGSLAGIAAVIDKEIAARARPAATGSTVNLASARPSAAAKK